MTEILPESIPLEFEGTPVQDVMVSKPICCRDTSTVADAVQLMVEHGIGGLPVVDDGGHVVGFVSDGDVMRCIAQHRAHSIFTGGDASMLYFDDQRLDERIADVKGRSVMDIATRKVVCSRPSQSIARCAATLSRRKFKMMPIVDEDGILVGLVTRSTLVHYVFSVMFP